MEGPLLNIWAVFILLGATHGLFLAIILWFKRQNREANRLFALLLGSIAFHLFEYALNISGWILEMPHLLLTSYPLLFVIGPLFYWYILRFLNGQLPAGWKKWLHFLPAVLILFLFLPFYLQTGTQKVQYIMEIGASSFTEVPIEQFLMMAAQVLQLLIYFYLSYRLINIRNQMYQLRKANHIRKFRWLKRISLVLLGFVLFYGIFLVIIIFYKHHRMEFDYAIVLLLSILLFVAGYVALAQPEFFAESMNDRKNSMKDSIAQSIKSKLEAWMEREKPYLSEELKISDVSEVLNIPTHHLSEVINQEYQTNFFDFVNRYRIEEAKRLLSDPAYQDQKILAIAFDTGFSNKGTFNRVFKKFTGQTPSAYRNTTP